MSIRPDVLAALATSVRDLSEAPQWPIPTSVIAALANVAKPGVALKIDLTASAAIGAPLVMVTQQPDGDAVFACLTPRQRGVATLLIEGRSNRQIAADLSISVSTVKDHVHAILHRLNLPSRGAVIAAAHSVDPA